jgi:hypothetical protein
MPASHSVRLFRPSASPVLTLGWSRTQIVAAYELMILCEMRNRDPSSPLPHDTQISFSLFQEEVSKIAGALIDHSERQASAASSSRKKPGLVAACKLLKAQGVVGDKEATAALRRQPYTTDDGRYTVSATTVGDVVQTDNSTKKKTRITADSFRTGYW